VAQEVVGEVGGVAAEDGGVGGDGVEMKGGGEEAAAGLPFRAVAGEEARAEPGAEQVVRDGLARVGGAVDEVLDRCGGPGEDNRDGGEPAAGDVGEVEGEAVEAPEQFVAAGEQVEVADEGEGGWAWEAVEAAVLVVGVHVEGEEGEGEGEEDGQQHMKRL
jgi:hypothetical protein